MKTSLDSFAGLLADLAANGSIPASKVSAKVRERLTPLFEGAVVVEVRAGSGKRIELRDPDTLTKFVDRHYPSGLYADSEDLVEDPRSLALARYRNTKALGGLNFEIVEYRLTGNQSIRIGLHDQHVQYNPDGLGAFALRDRESVESLISFSGTVATVENPSVFLWFDWAAAGIDLAVLTYGRMSRRMISWLASESMFLSQVVHFGDYDPVGLNEFTRLDQALGDRVSLFIPSEIEVLFNTYSNPYLLTKSAWLLPCLRSSHRLEVQRVLQLMAEYGGGLEHEVLVVQQQKLAKVSTEKR